MQPLVETRPEQRLGRDELERLESGNSCEEIEVGHVQYGRVSNPVGNGHDDVPKRFRRRLGHEALAKQVLVAGAGFAHAALVFADTIDDFVTVKYLSGPATSEPLSVKIYNFTRAEPTPAVNAAATFLLVTTTVAIVIGYFAYRRATRGQRTGGVSEFANV